MALLLRGSLHILVGRGLLATVLLQTSPIGPGSPVPQVDQVALLLEAFERGQPTDATFKDRKDFARRFRAGAYRWIDQAPAADKVRRRNVVALAALELSWMVGYVNRDQIEWPEELFAQNPPTDYERLWRLTVLTQVATGAYYVNTREGPFDGDPFGENLTKRARARFPDESRFKFLDILVRRPAANVLSNKPGAPPELLLAARVSSSGMASAPIGDRSAAVQQLHETIHELAMLSDDPVVGPEAHLRVGILRYHLNDLNAARDELAIAARVSTDRQVRYLANYVAGLSFDAQERYEDAATAFEGALREIPDAMSAARQRAVHLFLTGRAAEVRVVIGRGFTPLTPSFESFDPVVLYRRFEMRFYPERLRQLHEMVRP